MAHPAAVEATNDREAVQAGPGVHPHTDAFVGSWIGDLRGTHIGNLYAQTRHCDGSLRFDIHIGMGSDVATMSGGLSGDGQSQVILLQGRARSGETIAGRIDVDVFAPEQIAGRWSLADGSAGVLWLNRVPTTAAVPASAPEAEPVELVAQEIPLGSITLYRSEVEAIVAKLASLIPLPARVIITANIDKRRVVQYHDAFLSNTHLPDLIKEMTLGVSDSYKGMSRSIVVNLDGRGNNNFVVQSADRTWTSGAAADLQAFMARYTSRGVNWLVRHGLDLNFLIFIAALTMLPGLQSLPDRITFMVVVVASLFIFSRFRQYLQDTTIHLNKSTSRPRFSQELPTIIGSVAAGLIVLVLWALFAWIASGGLSETFIGWIETRS